MYKQSTAIKSFMDRAGAGEFSYVVPEFGGDADFVFETLQRPEIGDYFNGLPVGFEQHINSVTLKKGTLEVLHRLPETELPVLSTLWIRVPDNARVTIVERVKGGKDTVLSGITVVTAGKGSQVDYVRDLNVGDGVHGIFKAVVESETAATRVWQVIRCAGAVDTGISTRLLSRDAAVRLMNVVLASDGAEVNNDVSVSHDAERTVSVVKGRVLAFDQGRVTDTGRAILNQAAKGAEAGLDMKGLLNGQAVIHLVPKLRIRQMDIQAGHGAAVGPLDRNQLFYLESHGIGRDTARLLLLRAFVGELLNDIPVQGLTDGVMQELETLARGV